MKRTTPEDLPAQQQDVAERLQGIARELEAAADEGVVETLVADAAIVRGELVEVDSDFASLAPTRLEVQAAEARVGALRDEIEAAANISADLSEEGRERKAADELVERNAATFRAAETDLAALRKTVEVMSREEPKLSSELPCPSSNAPFAWTGSYCGRSPSTSRQPGT